MSRASRFHELASKAAIADGLVRVKNGQRKGDREKDSGQPRRDFREHIGRLRAENIFGDGRAKGRAETFALRPLHQDHQDHQQGDEGKDRQKHINQDRHWDVEYAG